MPTARFLLPDGTRLASSGQRRYVTFVIYAEARVLDGLPCAAKSVITNRTDNPETARKNHRRAVNHGRGRVFTIDFRDSEIFLGP